MIERRIALARPLTERVGMMKKSLLLLAVPLIGLGLIGCAPEPEVHLEWMTSREQALAKARAENKRVLANFTGSDWCGGCIQMEREVLTRADFAAHATNHLVLLKIDFPRKVRLPEDQARINEELANEYRIEAFPTFLLLAPDGSEQGRIVGSVPGGPRAFIAELQALAK